MPSVPSIVAANLDLVRQRIAAAAQRSGRSPDSVTLVAVTKYAPLEAVQALLELGCLDLGESRPQQLWERAAAIANSDSIKLSPRWHFIGHLQRNKLRRTWPLLHLLHAGDSERLVVACAEEARAAGRVLPLLLEVNISGDASKHGFQPDELRSAYDRLASLEGIELRGLMAMAGIDSDPEQTRREFVAVRALRDELRPRQAARAPLAELSMGMSGDFEIAIEAGATIVRVGSALFEGIEP